MSSKKRDAYIVAVWLCDYLTQPPQANSYWARWKSLAHSLPSDLKKKIAVSSGDAKPETEDFLVERFFEQIATRRLDSSSERVQKISVGVFKHYLFQADQPLIVKDLRKEVKNLWERYSQVGFQITEKEFCDLFRRTLREIIDEQLLITTGK